MEKKTSRNDGKTQRNDEKTPRNDEKTPRNDDWKKYDKGLTKNIALDDLRESIRLEDKEKVEKAIGRCKDAGLKNHQLVTEAEELHLPIIEAKLRLKAACEVLKEKKEDADVKKELKTIKDEELTSFLLFEVREAKHLLKNHRRHEEQKQKEKMAKNSLAMDTKTVAEIRRYQKPPPVLHEVVKGVLLLLGEDEEVTKDWKNCQRICNPYGADGLCRKVLAFEVSQVHPEIMARAREILYEVDFDQIQSVGKGAPIAFYVWAMSEIEKSEPKDSKNDKSNKEQKKEKDAGKGENKKDKNEDDDDVKPANIKRQKEIFGRNPKPPENSFHGMSVTQKSKRKQKTEEKATKPEENKRKDDKPKTTAHDKPLSQQQDDNKSNTSAH